MEQRPFRLISSSPVEGLTRTLEALLVVASAPLSIEEIAAAADDDPERIEDALRLVGERFAEERSGIVLELRRTGELTIEQAAPFAPIRVNRLAQENNDQQERTAAWTLRSA